MARTLFVATAAAARGHHCLCGLRIANVARVGEALSTNPDAVVDTAGEGFGEACADAKERGPKEYVISVDGESAGRGLRVDGSDGVVGLLLLGRAGRLLLLRRRRNLRGCGLSATCNWLDFTTQCDDQRDRNCACDEQACPRASLPSGEDHHLPW